MIQEKILCEMNSNFYEALRWCSSW